MKATLTRISKRASADPFANWTRLAGHSHMLRAKTTDFETAKANLVAWCRQRRITAFGLGSPWEPVSARSYAEHETTLRDRYDAGEIPPASVMDRAPIAAFLADMNRRAQGDTHFYLDNETPKNRYGHLWHIGFDYQVPAWHDYGQDRPTAFWDGESTADRNPLTRRPHRRRSYMEVVARQRAAGALAIWAHPTSWWRGDDGTFVTNIAADLMPQLHADGFLDGITIQGYDAFHCAYQALWFHLLDRGHRIPGFAELDILCDGALPQKSFLNHLPVPPTAPLAELIPLFRAGRHTVSSGPFLEMTVDGQPSGTTLAANDGSRHNVRITAFPAPGETALARVQLIGNGGAILAEVENFTGGELEFTAQTSSQGGYLIARATGEQHDPANPQRTTNHCAIANPVYLCTIQTPITYPVATLLTLPPPTSPFHERAPFRILTAAGDPIMEGTLPARDEIRLEVPASARLEITCADGRIRDIPIAMTNPLLRHHMNHLAEGNFLADHPHPLSPGEVPPAAFRYEAIREALSEHRLAL